LQGQQYYEENWIFLQNKVLPFTTQMEAKHQFAQFQRILAGCGFFLMVLTCPGASSLACAKVCIDL
jgi:hypothetical protein